ncbi:MAG TPA: hypothetical protein VHA57_04280 [Actinomycetota bacterium]|nr:hypothetical protein [Actinomycetota bacterium]
MIVLLDEQLDTPDSAVATALSIFGKKSDCLFGSLRTESPGIQDPDIPGYCKERGIAALVTANVKDFGAREVMFEGLMASGISVVVLRPGKMKLTPEMQTTLLLPKLKEMISGINVAIISGAPILVKVTPSDMVVRHAR